MNRFVVFILACFYAAVKADVLHLTEKEFNDYLTGSTNLLVEFYAPWCGHCKSLAPEYKTAGETFQASDDVKLIAIDATEAPKLSSEYGIQGYPTLKWFPKGSITPEDYGGGRTAETIVKWINEKIGTSRAVKTIPSAVTVLTEANFDSLVLGSKAALVEFYAPWCGHCKSLAPKYEELAKAFSGEKDIVIGKVDCTVEEGLAARYGIQGFPSLKFFPAGVSDAVEYTSNRELEDFVTFLNTHAGTSRKSDGSLLETAGRIDSLDSIISAASYAIDDAVVASLKAAVESVSDKLKGPAKVYISIAEKVAAQGVEYVTKESRRIGNIMAGNITPESKTNFQIKQNILKAFAK